MIPTPVHVPTTCVHCGIKAPRGTLMIRSFGKTKGMVHSPVCPAVPVMQGGWKSDFVPEERLGNGPLSVPPGLAYLPYQNVGIRRLLHREQTTPPNALGGHAHLLADEMGLGKTIQAIGYLNQRPDLRKVLLVCPASLRLNWRYEVSLWDTQRRTFDLLPQEPYRGGIGCLSFGQLKTVPTGATFDLILIDEAHAIKNPDAERTKQIHRLVPFIPHRLLLSGSPLENRAHELWVLLQLVAPEEWDPPGLYKGRPVGAGHNAGYRHFLKRYCGAHMRSVWLKNREGKAYQKKYLEIGGSTHLDELHARLSASGVIRRLKRDVLKDLPAKRRQIMTLPIPEGGIAAEAVAREHAALAKTGLDYESDVRHLTRASIAFEELAQARKDVALVKVPWVVDHVNGLLESEQVEKIVVFAHHKEVIAALNDAWVRWDPALFTGSCTEAMRERAVQRFQTSPACRVFLGSHGAAGVGITLTAANTVVMAELNWKDLSQAEDRVHRIGQTEPVLVQWLVLDWSVDANMARLILKKTGIVEQALNAGGGV